MGPPGASFAAASLYTKSLENRILMVGFTHRGERVRIITARTASKKERNIYEAK
ncbi:MAG: BrnT family toxin [Deltaproteobacteria bacterium]|nr:BrnT family toxin [Deltaproteobacteria bacterium]